MRKQCTKCKQYVPLDGFYKRNASRDGLQHRCKQCVTKQEQEYRERKPDLYKAKVKKNGIKISCRRVGITEEFLEDYGDSIEWYCEICGKDIMDSIHMDHNHANGKFRGLLCKGCNLGLGNFKDSSQLLENAIKYLKEKP